ncbi:MAG: MerR family transcriptional regulator [Syntrophomonadaceae bacterium]|nr:MerR family transcriptional regulator [Syntrophomonadaceae bacterium]
MSLYTTGQMAKLCDVTVRTVQFYDTRNLLHPSELTEGGRRLYSEADLSKLRLICVLKSLGLSLDSIKGILESESPNKVLLLLLDEQAKQVDGEIREKQSQRDAIEVVRKSIKNGEIVAVDSICDVEEMMKGADKLRRTRKTMLIVGIMMDVVQLATIFLWIFKGIWWPFVAALPLVILAGVMLVRLYYGHTAYICPECKTKFTPVIKQFIFSSHTPKARRLTCTACGHNGWCIETYAADGI